MVKLNDVLPLTPMLGAPNDFEIVGGATTVMLAFDVLLVAPFVVLAVTLLFLTPAVTPCTLAETVQEAPGATVPPDKLTEEEPAVAATVPPHVLLKPGVGATTRPAGSESVNAKPLNEVTVFEFEMVNVRLVVPFRGIEAAPKALVIDGGLMTVMDAEAVLFCDPASVELIGPLTLFLTPSGEPVIFTMIVHAPGLTVAPDRLTVVAPAAAVKVPPQLLTTPGVAATLSPVGNVSLKATPLMATVFGEGLLTVNVSVVVPPIGIVAAPKALVMVGGARMVMLAGTVAWSTTALMVSTPAAVAVNVSVACPFA
jgi:hypothetical protein